MFSFSFRSFFSVLTLGVVAASFSVPASANNSIVLGKLVSTGDLVSINTYNSVLNLRNAPCGQIIATVPSKGTGMVAEDSHNNTKMMCNGGNWTWVKVNFANASGFVAAEYLLKMEPKMELKQSYEKMPEKKVEPTKMPTPTHNIGNIWVTGSKVHVHTVMVPVQVRSTPCGTRTALAWPKAIGTLMYNDKNFVKATCNGGTFSWVDVDFGNGIRGWVAKEYLKSHVNV